MEECSAPYASAFNNADFARIRELDARGYNGILHGFVGHLVRRGIDVHRVEMALFAVPADLQLGDPTHTSSSSDK